MIDGWIKICLLWFSWPIEDPLTLWLLSLHVWHTSWYPRKETQGRLRQLLVKRARLGFGTILWNGSFLINKSVWIIKQKQKECQQQAYVTYCWLVKLLTLFWYFLISRRATVPGLNLWGFLTPETRGADFLAIFWAASCFLGTFWAVDFLAVCFVRAIEIRNWL
jgi:hypothetical protein